MNQTTMRTELQEPTDTSLVCSTSLEPFNSMSLETSNHRENSKFYSLVRREYNSGNRASMSGIFVLDINGKPLTPTTNAKARKLMKGKQAKPVWNKFGQFGIQMLVNTRKEIPKTVLGCDFGTKFEGYSVICDKTNNLNIMWKLPDKKKLVKKLEERRRMRRARRWRNCRRRESRFDNRSKNGFIAPSQLQIVNSRLKCINELFNCYPIGAVAIEDVKFNYRDKRYGKNFSTVEVGKKKIYDSIRARVGMGNLIQFSGYDTQEFREKNNLHKSSDKSAKSFYSHCVDSFAIANELSEARINEDITYVDDSYRYIRRRLHDTQYSKGGVRYKFSTGKFQGISKGCIIGTKDDWLGQLVGGTKNNAWYCDFELQENGRKIYQKGKSIKKISWISHSYKYKKIKGGPIYLYPNKVQSIDFLEMRLNDDWEKLCLNRIQNV